MATVTNEELLAYINDLNIRVTNLSNSLDDTNQTVTSNYNRNNASINSLNLSVNSLVAEDNDLHNEIHEVSQNLTYTYSYLVNTSNDLGSLITSYQVLNDTVSTNRTDMDDEDWELHNEIHEFRQGTYAYIVGNTNSINSINNYLTEVPQHILLSEEEYERIDEPDPTKYYFVYEEE